MEPLRNIFRRPAHPEGRQLQAAHTVATATNTLQQYLGLTSHDVAAASYNQHTLVVFVSHPAIAGQIHHHHDALCRDITTALQRQNSHQDVRRIITRVTELPSRSQDRSS